MFLYFSILYFYRWSLAVYLLPLYLSAVFHPPFCLPQLFLFPFQSHPSLSLFCPIPLDLNSHHYLPFSYPYCHLCFCFSTQWLPRWGGYGAGKDAGWAGLHVVMMVLASIKSLQAAESISPVVKLHLTQRAIEDLEFLLAAASELCMCVVLESVWLCVILEWECMYPGRLSHSRTLW